MNIYVSGSLAYDRIMDFPGFFSDHILPDKIHILNVCFTVNSLQEKYGGTAGNIAYSLRLLGEKPTILATIGKDHANYFQWLEINDICADGIKIIQDEFTAGAYITTDRADNQITGFNPGAMKHQSEYSFPSGANKAIGLIAPGNLGDMMEYAKFYKANGIDCICDPGQSLTAWDGKHLTEWISGSTMLISNDYELELISKMTGKNKKELLGLTKTIITTLGEKGSLISTADGNSVIPAAKAKEVADPTGAGDAYRAGLLKGLVNGKDIETAAKIGAVTATYVIEKYGTQEHRFTLDAVKERFKTNFGEEL
ncbi:MAG: carbohydrate kinase family protein [Dissulfurispiraceae bacterium]|jgi:adenosine kinase